jgi:hypothetical protein
MWQARRLLRYGVLLVVAAGLVWGLSALRTERLRGGPAPAASAGGATGVFATPAKLWLQNEIKTKVDELKQDHPLSQQAREAYWHRLRQVNPEDDAQDRAVRRLFSEDPKRGRSVRRGWRLQ